LPHDCYASFARDFSIGVCLMDEETTDMKGFQDLSITIEETSISVSFSGPITQRAIQLAHQMIDLLRPETPTIDPLFKEFLQRGP
jgi:hypothetical protein